MERMAPFRVVTRDAAALAKARMASTLAGAPPGSASYRGFPKLAGHFYVRTASAPVREMADMIRERRMAG